MKVPRLWCDSHTSFKVKRSKIKVTRPIIAATHRAPYLVNDKAYELQTWYTDGGRRPASAAGAMTSKVKGQGRKVTWSVWAVLAQCWTCVIRGRRGHTVSAEPGGHTVPHFLLICTRATTWFFTFTSQMLWNTNRIRSSLILFEKFTKITSKRHQYRSGLTAL